jgi:hypothetical protein
MYFVWTSSPQLRFVVACEAGRHWMKPVRIVDVLLPDDARRQ